MVEQTKQPQLVFVSDVINDLIRILHSYDCVKIHFDYFPKSLFSGGVCFNIWKLFLKASSISFSNKTWQV